MQIKKKQNGNHLEITVEGRIDTSTAVDFGYKINDYIDDAADGVELIFDMAKIEYISSMGLRVFLELQKRMNQKGKMKLKNVSATVLDIFKTTGFTNIVNIEK